MPPVVHHALLGLSVAALWSGAVRVASRAAPDGLPRVLAAAPLAVAVAVGEALGLGLAGLGGSTVALTLAALVTWVVVRAVLPAPERPAGAELRAWWRARRPAERAILGALGGGALAWAALQLRHPAFGIDSEFYHLPEIVLWIQGGHPGTVEHLMPGLPVGNYPLTNEVTVGWAMGISRSFVPFIVWPWLTLAMTACAGWAGLRTLRVPPVSRGLALAALCSLPALLAWRGQGAMTDPAALAWLVCAAALFLLARERPALLAPAVVAAGLSIGVKTTVVPLALLVVALGLWGTRRRLREVRAPLAAAVLGATAVGGVWYLRNLVEHGSPIWPFVTAPWGDPAPPPFIALAKTTFLSRPGETVARLGDRYLDTFGGGLILLAGGILAPLITRARSVLAAAGAAAVGLMIWMDSPVTGIPYVRVSDESVLSTTRYLLPVVAAATVALALAASGGGRRSALTRALLLVALAVNLDDVVDLGFPAVPALGTAVLGAVVGAVVGLLASRPPWPALPRLAVPAVAIALGAVLAVPAHGLIARYTARRSLGSTAVTRQLTRDPGYTAGAAPVASSPVFISALAGDRLDHRLVGVSNHEPCPRVLALVRTRWLVVLRRTFLMVPPLEVHRCLPGVRPAFEDAGFTAYRPLAG